MSDEVPELSELYMIHHGSNSCPDTAPYHPRVWKIINHDPQPVLKSATEAEVSTTLYDAVYTREMSVFVPGLSELWVY